MVIGGQINLCWCCDGLARLSGIYCTSCLAIASCDPSWMLLAVRKWMDVAPSPFPCRFFFFPFPCLPSTACSSLTSQRTFISIHLKEQKHFLDLAPCGGLVDWMLICDKSDRWTLKEKRQEWPYWRWHLITRVSNVLWQDTGRLSRRPWFEATCCSICNYVFSSLAQNKGKYSQTSSSCKSLCVGRRWTVLAAAVQLFSSVTPWMAKKVVMNEEQWIIKCQCGQWVQMKTKEQLKAWIESGQPSF